MKASIGEWLCSFPPQHAYVFVTDKHVQLYRTSTLLNHGRQSVTMTAEDSTADHTRAEQSARQSWEDESLIQQGRSAHYFVRGHEYSGEIR